MGDDEAETVIGGNPVPTAAQAQSGGGAAASAGAPDDGEDNDGQEPHAHGPTSPPRRGPRE